MRLLGDKVDEMLAYLVERRSVQRRKEAGEPAPWTEDPVLQKFFFCCVERDDDRTSRAARALIQALPPEEQLAPAMFFRLLNRADTLEALLASGARTAVEVQAVLEGLPMVFNTIAYRVQVKGGLWNVPEVSRMVARAWKVLRSGDFVVRRTAQYTCDALRGALGMGPFVAYQAMQDIRWTGHRYEDEGKWCYLGGGAVRGLRRMTGEFKEAEKVGVVERRLQSGIVVPAVQARCIPLVQELVGITGLSAFDMEHNLCEYDKLCRLRNGETSGRKYKGGLQ